MIKDYSITISKIREHLKNYLIKTQLKSLVIGVSGGIDSALVIALAKPVCDKLNVKLIGRSITIDSNKSDEIERARKIGENFCTDFSEINLTTKYKVMREIDEMEDFRLDKENWEPGKINNDVAYKIRMGNIKARMRMIYLYNLANKTGGLVLSTDNYTEYLLGFWTLHGDVGDYGMIQELWKTEVYEMSEWLVKDELFFNKEKSMALYNCIEATATDGLGITTSDLEQILPSWKGSSRRGYEKVDEILIDADGVNLDKIITLNPVTERSLKSAFKRNNPLNLKRSDII